MSIIIIAIVNVCRTIVSFFVPLHKAKHTLVWFATPYPWCWIWWQCHDIFCSILACRTNKEAGLTQEQLLDKVYWLRHACAHNIHVHVHVCKHGHTRLNFELQPLISQISQLETEIAQKEGTIQRMNRRMNRVGKDIKGSAVAEIDASDDSSSELVVVSSYYCRYTYMCIIL